ncbi:MAG: hydrolase, partial [Candidatus Hydrothermae bacterium]|nr:hydrolase [Candidatus Hydrothermae bacterium]
LQDRENLYVAFRCLQKAKADIRITQKDECGGDCVGIFLDTFHDGRTAYGFEVNRAGVLEDYYITDDGRERDWS